MNVSVPAARDCIQWLAVSRVKREVELLADDLERATGISITELAKLSKKWLVKKDLLRNVGTSPPTMQPVR